MSVDSLPQFLTKHCSPQARQAMLEGSFRIGTLREFRSAEIDSGAFSDLDEGRISTSIVGDVAHASFMVGTNVFHNCTMSGNGVAIRVNDELDANAFCASVGPYRRDRHERLMSVSENYKGNPDWTAHLVLDTKKLVSAFVNLVTSKGVRFRLEGHPIRYGERHREGRQAELHHLLDNRNRAQRQLEAIFIKPHRFELEEEMRFVMFFEGTTVYQTIWTKAEDALRDAFRSAIHDEGSDNF